jgi:hypothetical protein
MIAWHNPLGMFAQEGGSPPMSAPPVFTPPDVPPFLLPPEEVIVTQPTPEIEHHKGESRQQTNRYAARTFNNPRALYRSGARTVQRDNRRGAGAG